MFDAFLLTINQWMTGEIRVAAVGAFAWGMVSVLFSLCHLASIPLIVAYVGGQQTAVHPRRAAWYAIVCSFGLFMDVVDGPYDCCGMGGNMGFKKGFHEASLRLAAPVLKKIRTLNPDGIVTDCLSCRLQFRHALPYPVHHPMEILNAAEVNENLLVSPVSACGRVLDRKCD